MQHVDGEFYPEKGLDKNFRIPRQANMPGRGDSLQKANNIETPLASSYYNNYSYDPRAASSYYQFYQGYGTMSGQGSQQRVPFSFNPPPPPPPPGDGVDPIKQNIYNTLRNFKEKPKVYGKNIYDGNRENYDDQGYGNKGFNDRRPNQEFDDQGYKYQGSNSRGFSNERDNFDNQLFNRERYHNDDSCSNYGSGRRYAGERLGEDSNSYHDRRSNCSDYERAHHFIRQNQEYDNDSYHDHDYNERRNYNNERRNSLVYDRDYDNQRRVNESCNQDYGVEKRDGPNNQNFNQKRNALNNNQNQNTQSYDQKRNNNQSYGQKQDNNGYDWKRKRDYKNEKNGQKFIKGEFNKQQKKTFQKKPAIAFSVQQTVPDLLDESLPKDLKILFQPLFCKLCSAQLSSNQAAKMHYKSKNHEKKIRKWLTEWSQKTGEPLHKRALATNATKKEEGADKNPAWFHCDVCDLELTGRLHAESHYMGRNHQKALLGHKNPSGQGYYRDGKWVRVKGQKTTNYNFEKGEDNFGLDFKKSQEETKEGNADSGEPPAKKQKKSGPPAKFHCEVCNVDTTCQDQLDNHYRGQKHMKKLKQLGLENSAEHGKKIEPSGSAPVPATSEPPADVDMNLSVYRTPSGDYYCPICNLTANSEPQFIQHMRSKGHAKKAAHKKAKTN